MHESHTYAQPPRATVSKDLSRCTLCMRTGLYFNSCHRISLVDAYRHHVSIFKLSCSIMLGAQQRLFWWALLYCISQPASCLGINFVAIFRVLPLLSFYHGQSFKRYSEAVESQSCSINVAQCSSINTSSYSAISSVVFSMPYCGICRPLSIKSVFIT